MKAKVNWKNIKAYIQGKIRLKLFYSKRFNKLLPLYIFEQINFRLFRMKKECYDNGQCVSCGCDTPALQMANKTCGDSCYPVMMDSTDWHIYKRENNITFRYWGKVSDRNFELRITHTMTK
jgi:hypothetical protein